jgi:curved DNA-binding protein
MVDPVTTVREAFATLGLTPTADRVAVAHAYRRLARTSHPDVSAAPDAAARFDRITSAYRVAYEAAPTQVAQPEPVTPRHEPRSATSRRPDLVVGPVRWEPSSRRPTQGGF